MPVLKPSQIITKQVPMTSNTRSSGDLLLSREIASLATKDISKDSSVNLIQKAHEMYNQKYPQKIVSLVSKPPKIPIQDLATIDEAEQKEEQNTFAQGLPMGALLGNHVKDID